MVKSIFEVERRFNINVEYDNLYKYLKKKQFTLYYTYQDYSFFGIIDAYFDNWPFNNTAFNVVHYFQQLLPKFQDFQQITHYGEEGILYFYEFIINFIDWLYPGYEKYLDTVKLEYLETNNDAFDKILDNIKYQLEKMNYKSLKHGEHLYIVKRDADLDSILSQNNVPIPIKLQILSYFDFRIVDDVQAKMNILKSLGDYIEPMRDELKSYDSSLTDNIFYLLNEGKVRHPKRKGQIKYTSTKEQIDWYDKLFKMILHALRNIEMKQIKDEVKELKRQSQGIKI